MSAAAWRFSRVPSSGIQHIRAAAVIGPTPAIEVRISKILRGSGLSSTRARIWSSSASIAAVTASTAPAPAAIASLQVTSRAVPFSAVRASTSCSRMTKRSESSSTNALSGAVGAAASDRIRP